jgi:hypothetical protein
MATIKYPVQAANGKLLLSNNAVAEAIISVIQTRYGERVFRNSYGNDLDELRTVSDIDATLADILECIIAGTIEYQPLSISVDGYIDDLGLASIAVEYRQDGDRPQTINLKI